MSIVKTRMGDGPSDIGYDIGIARMHQTTIRFSPELWAALESEARRSGVSIAHYVRDAAISRLAFAAGVEQGRRLPEPAMPASVERPLRLAERIKGELDSAEAVRAQGHLARERSRRLREQADLLRAKGRGTRDESAEWGQGGAKAPPEAGFPLDEGEGHRGSAASGALRRSGAGRAQAGERSRGA